MEQIFMDELELDYATNDLIKARMLVDSLPDHSREFQAGVLEAISVMDVGFEAPVLSFLLDHADVLDGIDEDMLLARLSELLHSQPGMIVDLLGSSLVNSKVRLAEVCETLSPGEAGKGLLQLLQSTDDDQLLLAVLKGLGGLSYAEAVPAIADFLYSRNRDLVEAAVQALQHIETPAAVDALVARLGNDSVVDARIMQALEQVGSASAIAALVSLLGASSAHARTRAKTHLEALATHAVPVLLNEFEKLDEDAQIHALNVLGVSGDTLAVQPIRNLLHNEPANANVRFAAYEALGMLPQVKGGYVLAAGLADADSSVRIATARAIERNLDSRLAAGLKNLTKTPGDEARDMVRAFADARADQSVLMLSGTPVFADLLVSYLCFDAHPDLFDHFRNLFEMHGRTEITSMLKRNDEERSSASRPTVYAVDDSRMILGIYKKHLFELGVEVELFEFPAMALARMEEALPIAVFTDLNMPEIDGVELTRQIRSRFGDALPVMLVTTQSEGGDMDAAEAAGINAVLAKPFSASDLGAALEAQGIRLAQQPAA